MEHIVTHLTVALLIGIQQLCNARCTVVFDKDKCDMLLNRKVIIFRYKDVSTDLWTLPINGCGDMWTALPQSTPGIDCALHASYPTIHPGIDLASFMHSVHTHANGVKFAHQLLCNPKILTLLKVVWRGFLKGCPNLTKNLTLKYLNPNPVTMKGHMKWPCHGIKSTAQVDTTSNPSLTNQ
jgi:hypothetical protein